MSVYLSVRVCVSVCACVRVCVCMCVCLSVHVDNTPMNGQDERAETERERVLVSAG